MKDNNIRGLPVSFWEKLRELTNQKLMKKDLNFFFVNPPKHDGSYLKTNGQRKYTNLAYAVKSSEVWIELELKPIKKEKQQDLYNHLLSNKQNIEKGLGETLRWDDEDIKISKMRRATGKDFRIKLISNFDLDEIPDNEESVTKAWSDDMIRFICELRPYLV